MANSDQDRIVELETRIAFLEQNVDDLNDVIAEQQKQLSLLEGALKHISSRLEQVSGGDIKSQEQETPPPHY